MKSSMRATDTFTSRTPSKSLSSGDLSGCGAQHEFPANGETMFTWHHVMITSLQGTFG